MLLGLTFFSRNLATKVAALQTKPAYAGFKTINFFKSPTLNKHAFKLLANINIAVLNDS